MLEFSSTVAGLAPPARWEASHTLEYTSLGPYSLRRRRRAVRALTREGRIPMDSSKEPLLLDDKDDLDVLSFGGTAVDTPAVAQLKVEGE